VAALQQSTSDCGYACISALLGHFKTIAPIHSIKEFVGSTERGLSINQMQLAFQRVGATVTTIAFDRSRPQAYPCPGVVLLRRGHYVCLIKRKREKFKVFDPAIGWLTLHHKHFALDPIAIGIEVLSVKPSVVPVTPITSSFFAYAKRQALSSLGKRVLLASLGVQLVSLSMPLLTQKSVDAVIPTAGLSTLGLAAIAFMLISATGSIISLVAAIGNRILNKRLGLAMAGSQFNRLANQNIDWFQSRTQGFAFSQYQALVSLQQFYGELPTRLLSITLTGTVGIAAMFYIFPWLVAPGLLGMAISSGLDWAFRAPQQSLVAKSIQAQITMRAFFYDVVSQLPLLVRFGTQWRARSRLQRNTRNVADAEIASARLSAIRSALNRFSSSAEQLTFVCLASYFVKTEGYTLGVFVAAGLYKDLFANALSSLFGLWQQYSLLLPQREQLAEVLSKKAAEKIEPGIIANGTLKVSNASFRYGTLDPFVLNELCLEIRAGECVALKGPSGSGKTTLIKLLCGAVKPSSGEVLIDGKPASQGMKHLGVVLQSDRLITGSIRENILLFRGGIQDEEIYEALKIVGLDDFVQNLPMQLNTGVGEGMTGLSGGQRQRILLARAMLDSPKLLIFDEATSSLDVEGERQIFKKLKTLNITLIVCSHRPEVWAHADAVYEIADGIANRCR
jgi:ATP-binding cassette, subfamily B, bacterial CvaB/MchF/RaxB